MIFKTIEDEATISGRRITSIFSGIKAQIQGIFSKTNTISFSSNFTQTLQNDEQCLLRYNLALRNGMTQQEAFNATMLKASPAAQGFANSLQIVDGKIVSFGSNMKAFTTGQKQAEIAIMAQNKSLSNSRALLNTYNSGLSNIGLSQQQFTESIAQSNPQMARYLVNLNGGKASMWGYVGSLVASTAATTALKIATIALNAVIGMGIGAIVSLITSGLATWISSIADSFKSTEEKLVDCNAALQEISDTVNEAAQNFQSLKQSVSDIAPRFVELARGVDRFGENVSLTDEEYEEFLKLNNELAQLFPELNLGMDSNGNYMLSLSYSAETLADSLQELIDKEREAANIEIAKQIPDAIKQIQNFDDLTSKSIDKYQGKLDLYDESYEELKGLYSEEGISKLKEAYGDNWEQYRNTMVQTSSAAMTKIMEAWGDFGNEEDANAWRAMIDEFSNPDTLEIDWWALLNSDVFAKRMAYFKGEIGDLEAEIEAKWNSLASYMNAWAQTDDSFNMLDDTMQSIASNMIGNIDYGSDGLKNSEEIKKYITDNIITPLKDLTPEARAAFENLFKISPDTNSLTDYKTAIQNAIKEISNNSDFEYDELLKITGYDKVLDTYETNASEILKQIEGATKEDIYSLSPTEISKAFEYVEKYGIKTWDELESALDNKTFEAVVDFEIETENMESFKTAIEESVSAAGLSSESISKIKARYQDLENYDASKLFERTTSGIHLNTKALNELEEAYESQKSEELQNKLKGLEEQYNSLTREIDTCTDAKELYNLYAQRNNVLEEIEDTSNLASQYAALTSAYNKWQDAKNRADERDKYENIGDGYESIKNLINQGWVSDSEVNEYLDLLLAADKRTNDNIADFNKLTSVISGTNFSIMDFFQYDEDDNLVSDGLFNFLDAVKSKLGDEFVQIGEDGAYSFDFAGDKINKVAEALGLSVEAVQILEQAMIDAGFDVIFDSTFSNIDNIKTGAKDCVEVLKELKAEGKIDSDIADFNFRTSDIEDAKTQIEQAKTLLKEFLNEDGSINLDLEGAKEAASILATLIYRKSDLSNPTLMSIDVGEAESDIEYAISLLQQFKDATANLELQTSLGMDTTDAQATVDGLLSEMSKNQTITGTLDIDTTSVDTVLAGITSEKLTAEVLVSAGLDSSKIDGYVPADKSATVTYETDTTAVDNYDPPNFDRTVTFNKDSYEVDTYNPKNIYRTVTYTVRQNGKAEAQGTAFKSGSWGTKESGVALGGELGQELVVRDGRFFTIGDDSAEFFEYKKDDIIFNAEQTEQILKNGKINRGSRRGKAFVEGTAFDSGSGGNRRDNGGNTHNPSSSSSSKKNSSSKSSSDNEPKTFDWIEVAIDRIERAIDRLKRTAESTYKSLKTKLGASVDEISKVNQEIALQQQAYNRYMQQANSVGLSSDLIAKVQSGAIEISEYDDDTQELISEYQEFYEKALDCSDAIDGLHENLASLYEDNFNNIADDFENQLSLNEHLINQYENGIDLLEAKGYLTSTKYYSSMKDVTQGNIDILNKELADLTQAFSDAMNSGEIEVGSESWYQMQLAINSVKEEIAEAEVELAEYAQTMREIEWGYFDFVQERIEQLTQESDFLIDLMSNADLHTDKGQLTDEGMATMGLHAQNYNVYMAQADAYAEELANINAELANDPNNTELIERREELLGLQQDAILAAEDEKQAIVSLVEEGIKLELDSLKELIDTYTDALDSAKSLYDYQKKVKEQTENIASLKKQLSAYENDLSEETRATVQKITIELADAEEELAETEWEQQISEQKKLLDELYLEYETILNQRLDNVDALIGDMITAVNDNTGLINETLTQTANDVGYTMTTNMQNIWNGATGALDGTISKYGDGFNTHLTSIQAVLGTIQANTAAMIAASDKEAETTVENTEKETTPTPAPKPTTPAPTNPTPTTPTEKAITVGGKINAKGAKIYDYAGDTSGENQYFKNDPIYKVLDEKNGYLKVRWHKLSSGVTGWFKKNDVKAYKTGGLVDYTGLAQVDGTPGKPELMLNSEDTKNFLELRDLLRALSSQSLTASSYGYGSPTLSGITDISRVLSALRTSNGNLGTTIGDIEINIPIDHVDDYNDFVTKLQNDGKFEKMVVSMTVGQLAGKSSLEKNKYKW